VRLTEQTTHSRRDALVIGHIGLVKTLARRLAQRVPGHVDVNELISVGVIGLIDAASRYQASTGVPFEAFSRRRVQGAMLDSLRELDWAPRSLRRLRRQFETAIADLRRDMGREPNEREIAQAMKLSEAECARALDQVRGLELANVRELDAVGRDGNPLIDLCVDPSDGPDVRLERSELRRHLSDALNELPVRERQILALYYEGELTLAEIGEAMGVSESRISQLRTLALARVRQALRSALGLATPEAV
jgi:RNA polymerase sigma factor for flagellar operon FliA